MHHPAKGIKFEGNDVRVHRAWAHQAVLRGWEGGIIPCCWFNHWELGFLLTAADFCAPVKPNYGRKVCFVRLHLGDTSPFDELEPFVSST